MEELAELRDVLRRFFAEKSPSTEVRRLMQTRDGYEPAFWEQMAGQLGLQGLAVPEEFGGSGFGMREVAVTMEEMGRALVCAPYLSSAVLAAGTLVACGNKEAQAGLLPGIADGSSVATLAWMDGDDWGLDSVSMTARREDDGWVLNGAKSYVLDGHTAGLVLIAARVQGDLALFAVDGDADGLTRTTLTTLDQTRRLARLEFDGVRARLIEADARPVLERALDLASV
ncbi:acyl-CoA dehydrogenase family protein, partial [Actinomadura adrarensis]